MNKQEIINEGKRVIEEEIKALSHLSNDIDERFYQAVKYIASANKVILSGVGKSGLIAQKIAGTLSSYGVTAIFMHPVDALHGDLGVSQKGDVAILLSKSGSTGELIKMLPYLKNRIDKIISIVGNPKSKLAANSDVVLNGFVANEACPFNLAPTNSSTASLAIGDALAIASMEYRNVTLEDFSKLHPLGQIGRNITLQVQDIMHGNDSIPIIMNDSTFKDAIIEISNKKLGCVCITDHENKLRGIITDGDVRRVLEKYDDIKDLKVEDMMTHDPVSINADVYLGEALSLMENRESQINVLPVVDNRRSVIGVVRVHDIVRSGI